MMLAAWIAVALAALVLTGWFYQRLGLRRDARRFPPPGQSFDIGGGCTCMRWARAIRL